MKSKKVCLLCAEKRRKYYKENREKIKNKTGAYYKNNRTKRLAWQKQYGRENKEHKKDYNERYYQKHKKIIVKRVSQRTQERKKSDPVFKLRKRISADVWKMLKVNGSPKDGSIRKFLPYSIQELKEHLERQFESWMIWENWAPYNKDKWDDHDSSTWTWNIDHIIPHHIFKYMSMQDQEFKDCWALSNLRPLSSKLNLQKNGRVI